MWEVKNRIAVLDAKGEITMLPEDEVAELHDLSFQLHTTARVQNSISWQNARMHWLRDGDANIKFFHAAMSSRRRQNAINMLSVGGINVEGVQNIRAALYDHFSNHFKAIRTDRPNVEDLNFRKLSFPEAGNLTKPFSLEEVKQVVWDCDSFKSPGPDGINFDFIKKIGIF